MIPLELWGYTFRRLDLSALAGIAAGAGFAHITTTPGQYARSTGDDLRSRLADQDVTVSWIDGLCSALPGTPRSVQRDGSFIDPHEATLDDCIRIAQRLGAPAINLVHIGGVAQPVTALADAFGAACRRAAVEGLRLGIEFVPGTGIPDLATAAAIVRGAAEVNGSVLFDSWHWARAGGALDDLDPATITLLGGLQLSDRLPDQDALPYVPMQGRKLPGHGALPLAAIVRRVHDVRPDLPVGVEVLSDEIDALDPADAAARLGDACRAVIATARR